MTERRFPRAASKRALDERRLLMRYREHGDLAARDELTRRFMPLVRQLASRYRRSGEPLEDLVQVAGVGLVKALDRFDPERGTAMSTFAVPTILGELRRYFRDSTWSLRVSRDLQECILQVERASGQLESLLGRPPSVAELAAGIGRSEEEVVDALGASSACRTASLDESRELDDGAGATLADTLGFEDDRFELVEDRDAVDSAMGMIDERAREILRLRFDEDMTQREIAAKLGISQMHVSRLLREALATLRANATAQIAA